MILTKTILNEMIEAAELSRPGEAVGLVFGDAGRARSFVPLKNTSSDDNSFAFDSGEVNRVIASEGSAPIGSFHSHPTDIASPSVADIKGAEAWPRAYHFILSLRDEYRIGCFMIFDGQVLPEPVQIV